MATKAIISVLCSLTCYSFSATEMSAQINHKNDTSGRDYSRTIQFTEKSVHQVMRKHHLPALAIALVDENGIIYREAFGLTDIENNTAASTKSVFKIWSVAKVFTAIEIFREVEEGLVDLSLPITQYLPEFNIKSRYNHEGSVTLKSILAHRSGLPRNKCVTIPDATVDIHFLERFEKSISDCFMAFPVGYRYKYSNLGYDLLGRVIEKNRNEGFAGFMRDHLLYDLGMKNSCFSAGDLSDPGKLAKGYEYYKRKYYPMVQSDISSIPSGNLYSTIEDLSAFLNSVINDEVFNDKETMSQMFTDHYSKKADPERMGLGWKTTKLYGNELLIWHDGGPAEGTGALVAVLPHKKLGIAIIGNATSFSGSVSLPFAIEIFDQMLELKHGEYSQPEKPERIKVSKQVLMNYEGKYTAFGQVMDVTSKKNKLKGKIGGIGLDLIPFSETEFRITHWTEKIGLTKIIKPPIEFNKIKIGFYNCNAPDSGYMIINLDNISFELCSEYPRKINVPYSWNVLEGNYQTAERLQFNKVGNFTGRRFNIRIEDNVMIMSGSYGPIIPLDENSLLIASGPFAGEVIEYSTETGNLMHQQSVFVPVKNE